MQLDILFLEIYSIHCKYYGCYFCNYRQRHTIYYRIYEIHMQIIYTEL